MGATSIKRAGNGSKGRRNKKLRYKVVSEDWGADTVDRRRRADEAQGAEYPLAPFEP